MPRSLLHLGELREKITGETSSKLLGLSLAFLGSVLGEEEEEEEELKKLRKVVG